LIKEKDKYADEIDVTEIYQESVQSGRSMDEITKGIPNKKQKITKDQEIIDNSNPFDYISPQLAVAVKSAPKDQNWLYELKYDGYRILAYTEKGITRLFTRNGRDVTHYFKNVAAALSKHAGKRACVLDGEMVITDEKGKTDFQALQNHLKHTSETYLFILFLTYLRWMELTLEIKH
jgi:bifunctional non-homologous end joining protein LigD